MLNWRQPGSVTEAAPFSLMAAMNFSISAGTMSRSTALTKTADCATARGAGASSTIAAPNTRARAEIRTGFSILFLPMAELEVDTLDALVGLQSRRGFHAGGRPTTGTCAPGREIARGGVFWTKYARGFRPG